MIYKPGETFDHYELGPVKCVYDEQGSCEDCVFGIEGGSCDPKEYNNHPCYHSDREDEFDVHFIKA